MPRKKRERRTRGNGNITEVDKPGRAPRFRLRFPVAGEATLDFTFVTWREAETKQRELISLRERGTPVTAGRTRHTVASWSDAWLKEIAKHRPRTHETYGYRMRHVVRALGRVPLAKLNEEHLRELFNTLHDDPAVSGEYARNIYATLHGCLALAVEQNEMVRNPLTKIQKPESDTAKRKPLDAAQARRLVDAAAGTPLGAMIVLAVQTGAREGELLALTWADVDFAAGTIRIEKSAHTDHGRPGVGPTKTEQSERTLGLLPVVLEALHVHRAAQSKARLRATEWHDNDLLFCNRKGQLLHRSNFRDQYWYPLLRQAGLPRVTFHDIRHTALTLLIQGREANIPAVMEISGHSNAATLLKYIHKATTAIDLTAEAMGQVMSGVAESSSPLSSPLSLPAPPDIARQSADGGGRD